MLAKPEERENCKALIHGVLDSAQPNVSCSQSGQNLASVSAICMKIECIQQHCQADRKSLLRVSTWTKMHASVKSLSRLCSLQNMCSCVMHWCNSQHWQLTWIIFCSFLLSCLSSGLSKGYAPTSITYSMTPHDHMSAICMQTVHCKHPVACAAACTDRPLPQSKCHVLPKNVLTAYDCAHAHQSGG